MTDLLKPSPQPQPVRRGFRVEPWVVVAVVALFAAVIGGFMIYDWATHMTVDVNGRPVRLAKGTTVGAALAGHDLRRLYGDLVSVRRAVLRVGGGRPPRITVDGQPISGSRVLVGGDALAAERGTDVTEPVTRKIFSVESSKTAIEGKGPFIVIERPEIPGLEVVERGQISRVLVARHLERAPVAGLLKRERVSSGKLVALTFDDGPHPIYTLQVLAVLKKYQVKATFFELGYEVAGHPSLSRAVRDAGSEIGNHSYYHLNWGRSSETTIDREIRWTSDAIAKATGTRPAWLRPPGGALNDKVYRAASRLGISLLMWDVDTNDWRKPPPAAIAARAISGARPGAIILMHDGGGDRSRTVAALPTIIDGLKKRGYSFVTISDLFSLSSKR